MIVHLSTARTSCSATSTAFAVSTRERTHPSALVIGVLHTVLQMIEKGATHLGVATDHVIESFRNGLWASYKTGEGIEPRSSRNSTRSKKLSPPWESLCGP